MPFCFAYGANMCRRSMALRCPGAEPLGAALLRDWRFMISRDGYATLARDPGSRVHGVLWRLDEGHVRTLDAFERVAAGLYRRAKLRVQGPGGSRLAIVYVGRRRRPGLAVDGYMSEMVIPAAREWGFPEAYLTELARFARGPRGRPRAMGGF
jgi:gamma-glutamylcyclotransferase (GGCT)/AIG2-like uncharacterized protein YtfP